MTISCYTTQNLLLSASCLMIQIYVKGGVKVKQVKNLYGDDKKNIFFGTIHD